MRRAGGSETNQELNNEVSQGKSPSADGKVLDPKPRYHEPNLRIITSLDLEESTASLSETPKKF